MKCTRRQFLKSGGFWAAGGIIGGYPVFIERRLLQVNRYRIPVPHLPKSFEGFTIVHLTDLHYGPLVSDGYIRGVIERANAIRRDLTVCTGDYIQDEPIQMDGVFPLLGRLTARHGVFSTLGNHDSWVGLEKADGWLSRIGQNLRHRAVAIERHGERIWIGGAGDLNEDMVGIDTAFAGVPPEACKIVLAHTPDTADVRFDTRIDLMISGHTHGGQVVVPFYGPPILPVTNKRYGSGFIRTDRMALFISRGIGWGILPIRLNCPPEIAVLTLTREPNILRPNQNPT
jgi:hypothetical protein